MDENARLLAQHDARQVAGERRFLAVVVGTSGGLVQIRRLDQATADGQYYPARDGLAATVSPGDTVVCDAIGGTVIVDYQVVMG